MWPIKKIKDAVRRRKAYQIKQEISNRLFINPLCSDYENVFAQVEPYINEMIMVRPFGVGKKGGKLPMTSTPELALLNSPNEDLAGWTDFASAMFAIWLTEEELNIHVHRERNRVIGYSILPSGSKVSLGNGKYYFQSVTDDGTEQLGRDEVMTLMYARSTKDLLKGISPATTIRAWAQTEDVLAQYERAYIENGAIPASLTFIRASSYDKFLDVQKEMEGQLRGPKNHGKTVYVWRQFNNDTGDEKDQVEVKTIQGNNSTLAIKELTEIINDHLNKAFGVSNFILGDDSSAKYSNAEQSRRQFIEKRIYPALTKFWGQFQAELDRVTGGLGYAIQFEIELPDLTDREKTRAETAKLHAETLTGLVKAGASPMAVTKALGLNSDWKNVARGIYNSALTGASATEPKQKISASKDSTLESPKNYSRRSTSVPAPHSDCGHSHSPVSAKDELPAMTADEKRIYDILVAMAERIFANSPNIDTDGVIAQLTEVLNSKAEIGMTEGGESLTKLLENGDVVAEIKKDLETLELTGTLKDRILERTTELVNNYGDESKRLMNEVLANSEGKSASEIRKALQDVMPRWQAERIARTETVYAYKSGRLDEDKRIADKYGLNVELVWRARDDGRTCPVCKAMDGETVTVGQAFEHIKETADGTVYWEPSQWNDDGRIPAPHPLCRCYFDEIVEGS